MAQDLQFRPSTNSGYLPSCAIGSGRTSGMTPNRRVIIENRLVLICRLGGSDLRSACRVGLSATTPETDHLECRTNWRPKLRKKQRPATVTLRSRKNPRLEIRSDAESRVGMTIHATCCCARRRGALLVAGLVWWVEPCGASANAMRRGSVVEDQTPACSCATTERLGDRYKGEWGWWIGFD
jgi:hypothetical protein